MSPARPASFPPVRTDAEGRAWLPGVEEPLPAGERVRWMGRPDPAALARRALHVRGLAIYFALLTALTFAVRGSVAGVRLAMVDVLTVVAMAAAVLAFVRVYAAIVARATLYAVTDRRVVLRAGIAVPTVLNLPLDSIAAIDLRRGRDGAGDVEITLGRNVRLAYLLLWPHARPWHVTHPRPAFRGVPDAAEAGRALADVLSAAAATLAATPAVAAPAVVTQDAAVESPRRAA